MVQFADPEEPGLVREKESVDPGELNDLRVITGKLPFGEILIELEYNGGKGRKSLFYLVEPCCWANGCNGFSAASSALIQPYSG